MRRRRDDIVACLLSKTVSLNDKFGMRLATIVLREIFRKDSRSHSSPMMQSVFQAPVQHTRNSLLALPRWCGTEFEKRSSPKRSPKSFLFIRNRRSSCLFDLENPPIAKFPVHLPPSSSPTPCRSDTPLRSVKMEHSNKIYDCVSQVSDSLYKTKASLTQILRRKFLPLSHHTLHGRFVSTNFTSTCNHIPSTPATSWKILKRNAIHHAILPHVLVYFKCERINHVNVAACRTRSWLTSHSLSSPSQALLQVGQTPIHHM